MALLADALMNSDEQEAIRLVNEMLQSGVPVDTIVQQCNQGMSGLGNRFEKMEIFIPELMYGGIIMKKIVAMLEPFTKDKVEDNTRKTFLIGTVQHDIHDIGKDITLMVFQGEGFRVVDLGVDVQPEKFVEAIQKEKPDIVGMSLLLTTCYQSVFSTMEAITTAGLRDSLKICVGGAAASPLLQEKAACDFYGKTAIDAVNWARKSH